MFQCTKTFIYGSEEIIERQLVEAYYQDQVTALACYHFPPLDKDYKSSFPARGSEENEADGICNVTIVALQPFVIRGKEPATTFYTIYETG